MNRRRRSVRIAVSILVVALFVISPLSLALRSLIGIWQRPDVITAATAKATATPKPTAPPATATPKPTAPPATSTPAPTKAPTTAATPTAAPTTAGATATPAPTDAISPGATPDATLEPSPGLTDGVSASPEPTQAPLVGSVPPTSDPAVWHLVIAIFSVVAVAVLVDVAAMALIHRGNRDAK